ncbi:MAG: tetratricopeptide repeat protein [Planctomycetes bacterium]|nr:tetratricopeptide repeat protein [Planctomycetota bacterium]
MPEEAVAAPVVNLRAVLEKEEASLDELFGVRKHVYASLENRIELEKSLDKVIKALSTENKRDVRSGVALWILGRAEAAIEALEKCRLTREGQFFLALAHMEMGDYEEAEDLLTKVRDAEAGALLPHIYLAEVRIKLGKLDAALAELAKGKKEFDGRADYHYTMGFAYDMLGRYDEAEVEYTKALVKDPDHDKTLFRRAYNLDLRGHEEESLALYERLRQARPPYVSALINLGLSYEDRGEYEQATECYEAILETYPNHERARLYLRDAQASLYMYYDEEAKKKEHKLTQLLGTPISDMQLSIRSRNCLAKTSVQSLGDLVKKSEEELLQVKNFGETSLREIKEVLRQRGLALATPGQVAASGGGAAAGGKPRPFALPGMAGKEEVLAKPLSEFEWSARCKKCLEKLGLVAVSDLVQKSEAELLGVKNFGLTSLNEIKQKLAGLGLALKADA